MRVTDTRGIVDTRHLGKRSTADLTGILGLVALAGVPTALLVAAGALEYAELWLWGSLLTMFVLLSVSSAPQRAVAFAVAMVPFVQLLRSVVPYSAPIILFAVAALVARLAARGISGSPRPGHAIGTMLFWFLTVYYLLSFLNTGSYEVNLRVFELIFAAVSVKSLSGFRRLREAALLGMIVVACMVGLSMLPHIWSTASNRLGLMVIDGKSYGNPVQIGAPLAISFLALLVDNGRWAGLEGKGRLRVVLLVLLSALLLLTGSRGAWLMVVVGVLLNLLFNGKSRVVSVASVVLVLAVVWGVGQTEWGAAFDLALSRTAGEEITANKLTTGRSDQWTVGLYAVAQSPMTMLLGYGAGRGDEVYATYSLSLSEIQFNPGKRMSLHSLFLQILVETGIIGLTILMILLLTFLVMLVKAAIRARTYFPLTCFVALLSLAATVSVFGAFGGIMIGIALLGLPARRSSLRDPVTSHGKPQGVTLGPATSNL